MIGLFPLITPHGLQLSTGSDVLLNWPFCRFFMLGDVDILLDDAYSSS